MTMQMQQVPAWAVAPQQEYPVYKGSPRIYRFDGNDGRFWVGTERSVPELWIHPFCWMWHEGERWGRAKQEWFDLAFVDGDHMVSICSFKKGSAVNIQDYLQRLEAGKICECPVRAEAVWLHLVSVPKVTLEGEPYWVCTVEESNFASEAQFMSLIDFADSGKFEFHMVGEILP